MRVSMRRNSAAVARLLVVIFTAVLTTLSQAQAPSVGASLDAILEPYLARYNLPAVAAAVVRGGEIVASGAVGTRRAGADIAVTITDRFHIGSDTKAMTAVIAATLVEGGKIRWTSTVAETFPELAAIMQPDLRPVTLEQLLSHTSGIPSDKDEHERLIQQSFTRRNLIWTNFAIGSLSNWSPNLSNPSRASDSLTPTWAICWRAQCLNASPVRPAKSSLWSVFLSRCS